MKNKEKKVVGLFDSQKKWEYANVKGHVLTINCDVPMKITDILYVLECAKFDLLDYGK